MKLEDAIKQVAKEMNLPVDVCKKAYMSAWKFILTKIQGFQLSDELPIEEFRQLRTNFNMPSLGKFYLTEETFQKKLKRFQILKELKEKRDVQSNEN